MLIGLTFFAFAKTSPAPETKLFLITLGKATVKGRKTAYTHAAIVLLYQAHNMLKYLGNEKKESGKNGGCMKNMCRKMCVVVGGWESQG